MANHGVYFSTAFKEGCRQTFGAERPWRGSKGIGDWVCMTWTVGVASPWAGLNGADRGAEAEDGDAIRRGGPGRARPDRRGPRWGWPGRGGSRAGASGGSPNSTDFFARRDRRRARRASARRARDQLFAFIRGAQAAEKSQGENETTSAEKAIHEVQHLCQLDSCRGRRPSSSAPRESKHATTPTFAMRSIASHCPTASTAYRRIAEN